MMIKEDNDLVYDWRANHDTILTLRYVCVGSDKGNQQYPNDVLSRWNESGMGLEYWIIGAAQSQVSACTTATRTPEDRARPPNDRRDSWIGQ